MTFNEPDKNLFYYVIVKITVYNITIIKNNFEKRK